MSSPRMWGCSHVHDDGSAQIVFPTHVGMFLTRSKGLGLPHVCGDVPALYLQKHTTLTSSTRMWGCSCSCSCSLRVALLSGAVMSSPRMWGFSQKAKISLFCLPLESAFYISAFNEPKHRFSFKSFVCCAVRVPVYWTGYGSVEDTRHISALFVNLTVHLRRNHHVRRICSRS